MGQETDKKTRIQMMPNYMVCHLDMKVPDCLTSRLCMY